MKQSVLQNIPNLYKWLNLHSLYIPKDLLQNLLNMLDIYFNQLYNTLYVYTVPFIYNQYIQQDFLQNPTNKHHNNYLMEYRIQYENNQPLKHRVTIHRVDLIRNLSHSFHSYYYRLYTFKLKYKYFYSHIHFHKKVSALL